MKHTYSSKLIATGFELKSEGNEPLSVCPAAKWNWEQSEGFILEIDHGPAKGHKILVDGVAADPDDGMPVMTYAVDDTLHELIQSDKFNGISPVINVNEVNDNAKTFTDFTIRGISFQFEAAPVCPDDFCPTEYQGGDSVDKDEEIIEETTDEETTTEEPPKKVVKQKVVRTPAKDVVEQAIESTSPQTESQAEFVARLIRERNEFETRLKAVEADVAVREDAKREELLKLIPEDQRVFAEKLESDALLNVVNILNKQRDEEKAKTDATTIVEAGAVETTDGDTDQKKKTEETTDEKKDPEQDEREFFDMSGVFTVSEEKSGLYR